MQSKEINHGGRAHALLSASGAYRWLNCTPSARLEEQAGSDESSDYAKEGTWAHEFAEVQLRYALDRMSLEDYVAKSNALMAEEYYNTENAEAVEAYVDYVMGVWREAKKLDEFAEIHIEDKVDLTAYIPDGFGTNDVVILAGSRLFVIDLKFGRGVRVSAKDNPQLKLYGLGAVEKHGILYDLQDVVLSIHQPRVSSPSEFELSVEDLLGWAENTVKPKAKLAFEGKGDFVAGTHCHFCKVSNRCKALANHNLQLAEHDFAEPTLLSDSDLVEIYERSDLFTKWLTKVTDYVKAEALAGKKWEGLKLVEGRSVRQITSESAVRSALENAGYSIDQITNVKLKGITDLTKILGTNLFVDLVSPYVIKPAGKPTLVSAEDPRPEIDLTHKNDFENEEKTS